MAPGIATNEAVTTATNSTSSPANSSSVGQGATSMKKKFGKNLNKLTAPPTAPVPQGGPKANTSKNGLLLLSSKRSSSTTNTSAASSANTNGRVGASGGILSTKTTLNSSKPLSNLGLHTEYNPSTHDALMGVVAGASRMESQQQPDAWGVAGKEHVTDSVELALHTQNSGQDAPAITPEDLPAVADGVTPEKQAHASRNEFEEQLHQPGEFRSSNWDEYGGRNIPGEIEGRAGTGLLLDIDTTVRDQSALMSKLAKERTEQKRSEEEANFVEQKERAAQKLQDLENKMSSNLATSPISHQNDSIGNSQAQNPAVAASTRERSSPRKLFDPNESGKSYGALVRGTPFSPKQQRGLNEQSFMGQAATSDRQSLQPKKAVIQLSSYDATDRGQRGAETGPRMLFDPKSGSMVEVASREDNDDKKKKARRLKKKKNSGDEDNDVPRNEPKGRNTRKDEGIGNSRGRGNTDSNVKSRRGKGKITVSRRLPRTCGVLFSRDRRGNLVSVDKCDGDLGYGVHSVPGGKVKNSEAYSVYVKKQKQAKSRNGPRNERGTNYEAGSKPTQNKFSVPESTQPVLDWVKPNEKIELITGVDESPTLQATAREWAPSNVSYTLNKSETRGVSSIASMEENNEDDEEDEPFGLGFDPALNMDSMIQSPSLEPAEGLNTVDFTSLSLEPALQTSNKTSHNIFAFESGSTWGNNDGGGNNDWSIPSGAGSNGGISPTPFLSLSTGNAWGGFGSNLHGDRSSTSGD